MPLYTRETLKSHRLPWVEIDDYELLIFGRPMPARPQPQPDQTGGHVPIWGVGPATVRDPLVRELQKTHPRVRLICLTGTVQVETKSGKVALNRTDWCDIPDTGAKVTNIGTSQAEVIRFAGHWQNDIRTSVFNFRPEKPLEYHYHDGEEYWFLYRGHVTLHYAGGQYKIGPGDMMAAGMGWEHGVENPEEMFEGVGFATNLYGQKRDGHLVEDIHGKPTEFQEVPGGVFDLRSVPVTVTSR